MSEKPRLLPHSETVPHPYHNGAELLVATFKLSSRMDGIEAGDLKAGIEWWTRIANADLILLDIRAGEPMWLEEVLRAFVAFGTPVHIIGNPSEGAMHAMVAARSSNAEHLAARLGYPPVGTANGDPVGVTVVGGDVRFDLEVGGTWHTFRISREALEDLDGLTGDFDRMAVFLKHQKLIAAVASKLVGAGAAGDEILIRTEFFG